MKKITEQESLHKNLEKLSPFELLERINEEDKKVAIAVEKIIPSINEFVESTLKRMKQGGRLFYIGAGTSGRLGILDASECPPTFGVPHGLVVGIIAGGDTAIRKAVENAEDDKIQGWNDLLDFEINENDTVLGIAASGSTPYVIGAIEKAKENNIYTGGLTCNPGSSLSQVSDCAIVPVVGPEFVTGSTRMKSGTAQKMVLNMISTSLMIGLGKVKGNKMVDMQLSNKKLVNRGARMIAEEINVSLSEAESLLMEFGSVREVLLYKKQKGD